MQRSPSSDTVSGLACDIFSQVAGQLTQPKAQAPFSQLPTLLAELRKQANAAYEAYCTLCRKNACLGWEIKIERGFFGEAELSAHKAASEMLGKHRALHDAANLVDQLIKEGK